MLLTQPTKQTFLVQGGAPKNWLFPESNQNPSYGASTELSRCARQIFVIFFVLLASPDAPGLLRRVPAPLQIQSFLESNPNPSIGNQWNRLDAPIKIFDFFVFSASSVATGPLKRVSACPPPQKRSFPEFNQNPAHVLYIEVEYQLLWTRKRRPLSLQKLFESFKMSNHMIGLNHGHKIPLLWLKVYPG